MPQIAFPYVSEVEFLKQIDSAIADLKKIPFEGNKIATSFYVYIKINNLENKGEIRIPFYGLVRMDAWAILKYMDDYQKIRLIKLCQQSPFCLVSREMSIKSTPSAESRKNAIISAYYRGCFHIGLVAIWFPRIFNLGYFDFYFYEKKRELLFAFGEEGKYYEHIIFIDRLQDMEPGDYRYGIFLNDRLIYENILTLHFSLKKN